MKSMYICLGDVARKEKILDITREAVTKEEAKRRRFDLNKEEYVVDDRPESGDYASLGRDVIEKTFGKFAEEAKAKIPSGVDAYVYVGFWGFGQGDFEIPKSFFDLISETGWKVEFDYNS